MARRRSQARLPKRHYPVTSANAGKRLTHAVGQGVDRKIFANAKEARAKIYDLIRYINKNKRFPEVSVLDSAYKDVVLAAVEGSGSNSLGYVAMRVKQGNAMVRTTLNRYFGPGFGP